MSVSDNYLLGCDVLGAITLPARAARVDIIGDTAPTAPTDGMAAGQQAVAAGGKIAKKIPKLGNKLVSIGNKLIAKTKAAAKAKTKADRGKSSSKVAPTKIVTAFVLPVMPRGATDRGAQDYVAPVAAPLATTPAGKATTMAVPVAAAPTKASSRTQATATSTPAAAAVVAPKPVSTARRSTTVRGDDDELDRALAEILGTENVAPPTPPGTVITAPSDARGGHNPAANAAMQSAASETLVATVQELDATWSLASMGDTLNAVYDAVVKLDAAGQTTIANAGQAIVTRGQTVADAFDTADFSDTATKAKAVTSDANVWLASVPAAALVPSAPPPGGDSSSGGGGSGSGGGGGGGGGEEPPPAGGEEGGGEEAPPEGGEGGEGGEEGAPEGEEGAPPLEEQMYEEAYGRSYDGQSESAQPDLDLEPVADVAPVEPVAEDVSGDDVLPFVVKSELPKVSDEAWTRFALAMKTAAVGAVSKSNALGMYELKPRRLADLDLVMNLSTMRTAPTADCPKGRVIWIGDFVPPLSAKMFLTDPNLQYVTFVKSMKNYVDGLRSGTIPKPEGGKPAGASLSGVLAILHRAGPKGLAKWNDESSRFEDTENLYTATNGIF